MSVMPLASPAAADEPAPTVGRPVPSFTLPDVDGKKRPLSEFRGRRVALFFFCGCSWCADIGKEWASLQRGGALAENGTTQQNGPEGRVSKQAAAKDAPVTLVVYSELSAESSRTLASYCGLDLAQTVLLPDPAMEVTQGIYKADPCPRVFIVDAAGNLRYTNNSKDDAPRKAPALVIVSRAVDALRSSAPAKPDSKNASSGDTGW